MPDVNQALLRVAELQHPSDPRVAECWRSVVRGIELGWLDAAELQELASYLRDRRDWGVEELLFANLGDDVRVSFLDDESVCSTALLVEEIMTLTRPRAV